MLSSPVRPNVRIEERSPLPAWFVVGGLSRLIAYGVLLGVVAALA